MVEQILYKGRKRKLHKGSRGGRYVIVLGKKVYIRNKKKKSKSYLNKFKLFGGGLEDLLPDKLYFNVNTTFNSSNSFNFSFEIDTSHIKNGNKSIAYVNNGTSNVSIINVSNINDINLSNILRVIQKNNSSNVLGICLFLDNTSKLKLYFFNNTKKMTVFTVTINNMNVLSSLDRGSGTTYVDVDLNIFKKKNNSNANANANARANARPNTKARPPNAKANARPNANAKANARPNATRNYKPINQSKLKDLIYGGIYGLGAYPNGLAYYMPGAKRTTLTNEEARTKLDELKTIIRNANRNDLEKTFTSKVNSDKYVGKSKHKDKTYFELIKDSIEKTGLIKRRGGEILSQLEGTSMWEFLTL